MGICLDCSDAAKVVSDAQSHFRKASGLLSASEISTAPELDQPFVSQMHVDWKNLLCHNDVIGSQQSQ